MPENFSAATNESEPGGRPRRQLLAVSSSATQRSRSPLGNAEARNATARASDTLEADGPRSLISHARLREQIEGLLQNELNDGLHPEVQKEVRKHTMSLTAAIHGLQRAQRRQDEINEKITELASGRMPKGVRPFAVMQEHPELDKGRLDRDIDIHVRLENGLTFREAKKKLYTQYLLRDYELEGDMQAMVVASYKSKSSFDTFSAGVKAAQMNHSMAILHLGLEMDPAVWSPLAYDENTIVAKSVQLYKKVAEKIASSVRADAKEKDRLKSLRDKVVADVATKTPTQLVESLVEQKIEKILPKAAAKSRGKGKETFNVNIHDLLEDERSGKKIEEVADAHVDMAPSTTSLGGKAKGKASPKPSPKAAAQPKRKAGAKAQASPAQASKNYKSPGAGGKAKGDTKGKAKGKGKAHGQIGKGKGSRSSAKGQKAGSSKGKGKGKH